MSLDPERFFRTQMTLASAFIDNAVAERCSVLPVRLYHTSTDCFMSRRGISKVVKSSVIERFNNVTRPTFKRFGGDEYDEIKQLVLACTKFAILSHTWGDDEPSYQGVCNGREDLRKIPKFVGFSRAAADFGCQYLWLDTVCIDKSSSSEVDESIRSMFAWYRLAHVCIVYVDCQDKSDFFDARWLQRGWTLQELLAPKRIAFFGRRWARLFPPRAGAQTSIPGQPGSYDVVRRFDPQGHGRNAPEIDVEIYDNEASFVTPELARLDIAGEDLAAYTPSPRNARTMFKYMCNRRTTVPEDAAYCLLGLLGIVIPVAYGEGKEHALYRLQVACLERTNERNLLHWDSAETQPSKYNSILPKNPFTNPPSTSFHAVLFRDPTPVVALTAPRLWNLSSDSDGNDDDQISFSFTNAGLHIAVILHDLDENGVIAGKKVLPMPSDSNVSLCKLAVIGTYPSVYGKRVFAIVLERVPNSRQYRRVISIKDYNLPPTEVLLSRAPQAIYII